MNNTSNESLLSSHLDNEQSVWEKPELIELLANPDRQELLDFLEKSIVWQEKAKQELVDTFLNVTGLLNYSKWPLAKIFFSWPTWVGKTQMVKKLAQVLLWNEKSFTRISCENFQQDHTSRDLFGSPKSYVWYWEDTPLSEKNVSSGYEKWKKENTLHPRIKYMQNFNIILFDEVEKAHPDVIQWLLWVLDEWKINFPNGSSTDFSNTLFFFTSNVGQHELEQEKGKSMWFIASDSNTDNEDFVNKAIKKNFSPEFLWRLNSIIHFDSLTHADMHKICELKLLELNNTLQELYPTNAFRVSLDERVKEYIISHAMKQEKWARGMNLSFEKTILFSLNQLFEQQNFNKYFAFTWSVHIKILLEDDQIKFSILKREKESSYSDWVTCSDPTEVFGNTERFSSLIDNIFDFERYVNQFTRGQDVVNVEQALKNKGFSELDLQQFRTKVFQNRLSPVFLDTVKNWKRLSIFSSQDNIFQPYAQRDIYNLVEKNIFTELFDYMKDAYNGWSGEEKIENTVKEILWNELTDEQKKVLHWYICNVYHGKKIATRRKKYNIILLLDISDDKKEKLRDIADGIWEYTVEITCPDLDFHLEYLILEHDRSEVSWLFDDLEKNFIFWQNEWEISISND